MPLILISGLPASGKTRRAKELEAFFLAKGKKVHVVSENVAIPKAGFAKNTHFADSQKEKLVRCNLRSDILRLLNKTDVVILDAGNYIKGYRYELFCASKSTRSTQCTIFCAIQSARAWEFNELRHGNDDEAIAILNNSNVPYTRDIFDALCQRFEEPHSNFRWDSPLVVAFPEDKLNLESIYSHLYERKPLPPNLCTQNVPLSNTNYVFELDRITQDIVNDILSAQKIGLCGTLRIKDCQSEINVRNGLNAAHLYRLRRQFMSYSKGNHATSSSLDNIPQLFVQFINSNLASFT